MRLTLMAAILASGLMIWSHAADAHPHVFVDNRLTFILVDGKIAGFRTDWRFDEIFTEDLLSQFDADGDKQFSKSESTEVRDNTLPNLGAFRYFTYIYLNQRDLGEMAPSDFIADVVDGAVRFQLTYNLPTPIDPHKDQLAVSIYDREYYVEVLLSEKEVPKLEGIGADACTAQVSDDQAHAFFGGFVVPQLVTLTCR